MFEDDAEEDERFIADDSLSESEAKSTMHGCTEFICYQSSLLYIKNLQITVHLIPLEC